VTRVQKLDELQLLGGDQLDNKNFEHENKLTTEICQPGGARLKQADQSLQEFVRMCDSIPTPIIGSLLIAKLYLELPYIMKTRAVYAQQELVKKYPRFQKYYKHWAQTISDCPRPSDDPQGHFNRELDYLLVLVDNPNAPPPNAKSAITFNFSANAARPQGTGTGSSSNSAGGGGGAANVVQSPVVDSKDLLWFEEDNSAKKNGPESQLTQQFNNLNLLGAQQPQYQATAPPAGTEAPATAQK
jgi:hypothetical protein